MHSARPFRACVFFFLLLFALPAVGQEKISGPWVWLAVSGDGYVSYDHLGTWFSMA